MLEAGKEYVNRTTIGITNLFGFFIPISTDVVFVRRHSRPDSCQ